MTVISNPFEAISQSTPTFSDEVAVATARERYGLDVSVRSLVSERDQNFHMLTTDGRQFVLKIANVAEPKEVTDFQIQALIHIASYVTSHGSPISTPEILTTLDGKSHTVLDAPDGQHVARVVSYVEGLPIAERQPSARLCRNMAIYLAHLGKALRDFEHSSSNQTLLWDLQQALALRDLIHHIPTKSDRCNVGQALDDFEEFALPHFAEVRRQVIHSDFNPDNVLTDARNPDVVVGVIDFGDMVTAPLIADVAIGTSYARPRDGNPLALIAEFVAGYHSVTPLTLQEIDLVFDLVKARLCASIAILHWRKSFREPGDPYLEKSLADDFCAEKFLAEMMTIPRENAIQIFRQVCASEETTGSD